MTKTSRLVFRKSSYSGGKTQDCVEVAETASGAAIRDTKNRHLGHVSFGGTEWRAFVDALKAGEL
ncbi:DUF397 domain-containing protein [Nocardiopsis sp. CNT-189]|uniref:DUF397 domain-containing protein n=1 Tax=Nocardiopsis oceanisediminis TaxID=2816862 RepID=UPI003B2FBF55